MSQFEILNIPVLKLFDHGVIGGIALNGGDGYKIFVKCGAVTFRGIKGRLPVGPMPVICSVSGVDPFFDKLVIKSCFLPADPNPLYLIFWYVRYVYIQKRSKRDNDKCSAEYDLLCFSLRAGLEGFYAALN